MYTDDLYFKVDEQNLPDYKKHRSKPFTYSKKEKEVTLSFLQVPGDILEDKNKLKLWVDNSVKAAIRSKK